MARGWESKAVEEQQAEAARPSEQRTFQSLTPSEQAHRERLASLRLSQSQLRQQLERARHAAHRQQLTHALQELETAIRHLTQEEPSG